MIGIQVGRGSIGVGKLAESVRFAPDTEYVVDTEKFASRGKNTPYEGKQLKGQVIMTICEGRIVYQDGGNL